MNIGPITFTSFEDRLESAHASIDVGLRLNAGDLLVIYYVENVAEPTLASESGNQNRGYQTVRCATTFSTNFLGCAPETAFPTPSPLVIDPADVENSIGSE